jgi:leader peptidase (prepilin peptidase)/N-methyltransferase
MRTLTAVFVAVVVLVWLALLSCYDIRERRLPNQLTLPGAGVILLAAAFAGRGLAALAGV